MMDYEGTMRYQKVVFSVDAESIPGVPGASGRVPAAP